MKTMVVMMVVMGIGRVAQAQDQYLWLRLSGNRVMLNVVPEGLTENLLLVVQESRRTVVPLDDIEEIRIMREGSIIQGAAVGAGIGLAVGGAAGMIAGNPHGRGWSVGVSALSVGIIGGIVGSVVGSMDDMESPMDLRGKTQAEKKRMVEHLLAPRLEVHLEE